MKKFIVSAVVALSATVSSAQIYMPVGSVHYSHHHHSHSHSSRGADVAGAIVLGSIIGYGVSQANRVPEPQVIVQPQIIQPQIVYQNPGVIVNSQPRVVPLSRPAEPVYEKRSVIDAACNCTVEIWTQIGWR